MHRCKICLAPVLLRKKRKRLNVLSSSFVRQCIVELACKIGQNSDEAKIEFSEGYVCMSCFRAVGNYAVLKEIEGQLLNKLSASRYVEVDGSVRAKSCVAGTKRSHADASAGFVEKTVKVVVTGKGYEKRYTLSPSKRDLGKSLGRKSWKAFAGYAFETGVLRQHLFKKMLNELRGEFLRLFADTTLLTVDCDTLKQFDWDKLYVIIQSKAPLLHGVLETCIPQHSRMKKCVIVMCTVMLIKTHRRHTVVQAMVSIILHSGHTAKQVYCRLQKLGICLSSVATWALIDKLGINHDATVKTWSESLKKTIPTDHGSATIIQQTYTQCSSDNSAQTSHNSSMLSVFGSPVALPVMSTHSCDESTIDQSQSECSQEVSPFAAMQGGAASSETLSTSSSPPVYGAESSIPCEDGIESSNLMPSSYAASMSDCSGTPYAAMIYDQSDEMYQSPISPEMSPLSAILCYKSPQGGAASSETSSSPPPVYDQLDQSAIYNSPSGPEISPLSEMMCYKSQASSETLSASLSPPVYGVECSTPCQDGFAHDVDSSIRMSCDPYACISNLCETRDVAMIFDQSDESTSKDKFGTESAVFSPHLSSNEVSSERTTSIPPHSDHDDTASNSVDLEEWCGFRLVGDNIDKTVGPRDMRVNHQSQSLHYFHVYAVKDRVDVRHLSPSVTKHSPGDVDVNKFLPCAEDNDAVLSHFKVLMARVIANHVPGLGHLLPLIHNIRHAHSDSMAKKSEVVPLGVLLKNENKLDDMVEIMDELHKYIPSIKTVQHLDDGDDEVEIIEIDHFSPIVLGGDQLTTARAVGSQRIRKNSHKTTCRLVGFIPVTEDWHTKVCFMKVVWTRLYNTASGLDFGTLNQLRDVINRRNVTKDPSKNVNACEDFLEVVTSAHILASAMEVVGATNLAELQASVTQSSTNSDQLSAIQMITNSICRQFVKVGIPCNDPGAKRKQSIDHIQQYAMETISMGLLFLEFKDAIREGDGERVLRCWKYFMLLFRATRHSNYCIEALRLLVLYYYILPPRYAFQMLWGRFINTHGKEGCNVSADLHMEHLNRLCKQSISHLGANKTPHAIGRVSKALGPLSEILNNYDCVTNTRASLSHTTRSPEDDLIMLINELVQCKAFANETGRKHYTFPSIKCNQKVHSIDMPTFKTWMEKQSSKLMKNNYLCV